MISSYKWIGFLNERQLVFPGTGLDLFFPGYGGGHIAVGLIINKHAAFIFRCEAAGYSMFMLVNPLGQV